MTTSPAPQYLSYAEAAVRYGTSVRRLERLAATGRLTRHKSARDRRRTILAVSELDQLLTTHTPAA